MSNPYPTLFSRTSTGAVQEWSIEVEDNRFRVSSGQVAGAKVISEWTLCEAKNVGKANETTPSDQALLEAKSKYDKKARMGYTPDVTKIDSCMTYIEPMTAKKLKDRLKKIDWKSGVLVQNKYNGHRCVATFDGSKVVLKTRTGKLYYAVPHISEDLEKFFAKYPDAMLDGELFNNDLRTRLNDISSLIRKGEDATTDDLAESEKLIRFYVYDGYGFNEKLEQEADYVDRKNLIDAELPKFCKYCLIVKTDWAYSMADVDKIYNAYLADEQEGAIIRVSHSPYENKRSNNLLKHKPQDDDEGVIVALYEGDGNWSGSAKTATIKWRGKEFGATFKGKYELGVDRLKNPKNWIGKEVTFIYNGLTGLGVPNYARIDPDKCF
jgi:DNA ligase-1